VDASLVFVQLPSGRRDLWKCSEREESKGCCVEQSLELRNQSGIEEDQKGTKGSWSANYQMNRKEA
jgi:hypothetical protein